MTRQYESEFGFKGKRYHVNAKYKFDRWSGEGVYFELIDYAIYDEEGDQIRETTVTEFVETNIDLWVWDESYNH